MIKRFLKRFGETTTWELFFQAYMKDGYIPNDPTPRPCDTWFILRGRLSAYVRELHTIATSFQNKIPAAMKLALLMKGEVYRAKGNLAHGDEGIS